ncbi:MAG: single-stranded DNA-binding protein [Muribaculaceae bacterium]|nr:single-stranded DNA-binding protein [Muribaculaceae bacterium]
MSVNKVILIGNVGRDPEIRYPEKDFPVAYLTLATNERQGNSDTELVEWHILVMTGQNATIAERYIRKGTKLYVEGKLRTREYVDKLKISRRRTEIYVDVIEILGRG